MENCCKRRKTRDAAELRSLKNRLSRIEGQIRGISGMLDEDAYCVDILTQVSAAESAIRAFSRELLSSHIKSCVVSDIESGKTESADELSELVTRMLR